VGELWEEALEGIKADKEKESTACFALKLEYFRRNNLIFFAPERNQLDVCFQVRITHLD